MEEIWGVGCRCRPDLQWFQWFHLDLKEGGIFKNTIVKVKKIWRGRVRTALRLKEVGEDFQSKRGLELLVEEGLDHLPGLHWASLCFSDEAVEAVSSASRMVNLMLGWSSFFSIGYRQRWYRSRSFRWFNQECERSSKRPMCTEKPFRWLTLFRKSNGMQTH